MKYQDRITTEPGKRGGKPIIRGLRITVYDVLDYLASGMSEEEILSDFPELEQEDIRACLAFAADRERKLVSGRVKLLLDANISRRLIPRISGTFPDSSHVALLDLGDATDDKTWTYALDHGFAIVSKDEDFHQRALVSGPPPKVIWIRLGNCTTSDIEQAIQDGYDTIMAFLEDETASFLTLD